MIKTIPSYTPETMLLILLVVGHVFADFLIQTEYVATHKGQRLAVLVRHGWLTILTQCVFLLPFFNLVVLVCMVGLGIVHILFDAIRAKLFEPRWGRPLLSFLLDQILHGITLVVAWRLLLSAGVHSGEPFLVPADWLLLLTAGTLVAAGYVFNGSGGTMVVRKLLERYPQFLPATPAENQTAGGKLDCYAMGRTIGCLERYLIYTLVLLGQWGALGFVLAAKSIARFKEFENQAFADYYLIGTLASVLVAVATGLVVRSVI